MCTRGLSWDLLYILKMRKPQTFQEPATKAHDMKVTITSCHDNSIPFIKSKRDKAKFNRNVEFSRNLTKEVMYIFKVEPVQIT